MQNRMAILEGIAKREKAISEGFVYSITLAKEKMSKWLK